MGEKGKRGKAGLPTMIHRQVKLEHSNIFAVHNKQTW